MATSHGIRNVSDTARWVAVYRAMETERPDAHFRDPWARRLAGAEGEDIVASMPQGRANAWPLIVRTVVFDEVIGERVASGEVDVVLNLAAGLDTRPWRMDLPSDLLWLDVDLPGILDYKVDAMKDEAPRCRYEPIRADLTDVAQREAAFERAEGAGRVLVVTEGLLIYLAQEDVVTLARALHAREHFGWWLTDLASPGLLKMMSRSWGDAVEKGGAPFRFGPAESTAFFAPHGWREALWRPTWDEAQRLGRQMRGAWLWSLLMRLRPAKKREEGRRFSGYALLERA